MRLAVFCAVVLASAVSAPLPAQRPAFRATTDLVQLNVSVTDNRDRPVTNLELKDFDVTDNGVRQTILDVTYETVPIDVTLVVDVSASVEGRLLAAIVSAAEQLRGRLRDDDRLAIVEFGERVRERLALATAGDVGDVALGPAAGWTSLNDAIATAVAMPPLTDRRQMALVFTDGVDTISFLDEDTVLNVARRSRTTVFVVAAGVGLGLDATRNLQGLQVRSRAYAGAVPLEFFGRLAEATGGLVQTVPAYTMTQPRAGAVRFRRNTYADFLDDSFVKAFDAFRTSYVLHYAPEGVERDGWHDVDVRVTRRGRHQIRARSGYDGG